LKYTANKLTDII